ncbi:MAG: hypothetical protein GY869_01315, partial [Planctomycetes bacterium]|nr:hypothetical protein [Planctomycetota bacterium]
LIVSNSAYHGGGVYFYNGGTIYKSSVLNNTTERDGGGVYCEDGGAISNCTIRGNSAGYNGGGVWGQGYGDEEDIPIFNSLICGNSALNMVGVVGNGGGGYFKGDILVYNCTIINNTADNVGGGIYIGGSSTLLKNSIIYGNSATSTKTNYCISTSGTKDLFERCSSVPLPPGTDNIAGDPLIVNISAGNYHLLSNSPCIDAGNNNFAPMPVDLAGNPRIFNNTVDMGCYEFYPSPLIAITNYQAIIDISQTTAEISGTNANVDGSIGWTNDK